MPVYYLDTSALLKRYARERGSSWVLRLTNPAAGNLLYTVRLTGPEMIAAIFRKASTGAMALADVHHAATLFRLDWQHEYRIVEVSTKVADRAMDIAERHSLRGYDAVHLAAAIEAQVVGASGGLPVLTLVSSDVDQLRAAMAEGLPVDDPNSHS